MSHGPPQGIVVKYSESQKRLALPYTPIIAPRRRESIGYCMHSMVSYHVE